MPVSPLVFPTFDTPAEKPPPAPAEMVMVSDAPFVEPDRVMLLPPANTTRPATVPVSPDVFPMFDKPAENCVPVCAATDRSIRWPVFDDTVMPPPTPVIVMVPDVYVVFEAASPPTNVCVSGCTDWDALIRHPEFVAATLMIPSPRILRVRTSKVPLEDE